ncbi:hypothetical protein CBW65_22385 [Tumebacillus avium]|uniref:Uncharacterized protein n=1 Tax=Tumebacillus avium TaxID=1903704 RepID=A0A1Y0IVC6_9BACL|nr:hypothetical protein [Tumebacillus avium]ARU63435.1 hypothetical protein CBW65_22385 [Tumebacillus avium]
MLGAVFMIGSNVLLGLYLLYKLITGESKYYLQMFSVVLLCFGLSATMWMMYLEFPRDEVGLVLYGSLGVFGVLAPIGYVVQYRLSSRYQRERLRRQLWEATATLFLYAGLILVIIFVGKLFRLI